MRPILAALFLIGIAMPASAQQGAAAPAPSAETSKTMWCAAAFGLLAGATSDQAAAADLQGKSEAGFSRAAAELIPNGMTVEQFKALAEKTATEVAAPFRSVSYTRAECDAAVAPASGQ